ncbi:MAG: hypothetical protein ABIA93_04985, partial [Candidatus Woesearchaeota archaeon]
NLDGKDYQYTSQQWIEAMEGIQGAIFGAIKDSIFALKGKLEQNGVIVRPMRPENDPSTKSINPETVEQLRKFIILYQRRQRIIHPPSDEEVMRALELLGRGDKESLRMLARAFTSREGAMQLRELCTTELGRKRLFQHYVHGIRTEILAEFFSKLLEEAQKQKSLQDLARAVARIRDKAEAAVKTGDEPPDVQTTLGELLTPDRPDEQVLVATVASAEETRLTEPKQPEGIPKAVIDQFIAEFGKNALVHVPRPTAPSELSAEHREALFKSIKSYFAKHYDTVPNEEGPYDENTTRAVIVRWRNDVLQDKHEGLDESTVLYVNKLAHVVEIIPLYEEWLYPQLQALWDDYKQRNPSNDENKSQTEWEQDLLSRFVKDPEEYKPNGLTKAVLDKFFNDHTVVIDHPMSDEDILNRIPAILTEYYRRNNSRNAVGSEIAQEAILAALGITGGSPENIARVFKLHEADEKNRLQAHWDRLFREFNERKAREEFPDEEAVQRAYLEYEREFTNAVRTPSSHEGFIEQAYTTEPIEQVLQTIQNGRPGRRSDIDWDQLYPFLEGRLKKHYEDNDVGALSNGEFIDQLKQWLQHEPRFSFLVPGRVQEVADEYSKRKADELFARHWPAILAAIKARIKQKALSVDANVLRDNELTELRSRIIDPPKKRRAPKGQEEDSYVPRAYTQKAIDDAIRRMKEEAIPQPVLPPTPGEPDKSDDDDRGDGRGRRFWEWFSGGQYRGDFVYMWWLFDSEEDVKKCEEGPITYPADKGNRKIHWETVSPHLDTELVDQLIRTHNNGKVKAEFLGVLNVARRSFGPVDTYAFTDRITWRELEVKLKPGMVIALGAGEVSGGFWGLGPDSRTFETRTRIGTPQGRRNRRLEYNPARIEWRYDSWPVHKITNLPPELAARLLGKEPEAPEDKDRVALKVLKHVEKLAKNEKALSHELRIETQKAETALLRFRELFAHSQETYQHMKNVATENKWFILHKDLDEYLIKVQELLSAVKERAPELSSEDAMAEYFEHVLKQMQQELKETEANHKENDDKHNLALAIQRRAKLQWDQLPPERQTEENKQAIANAWKMCQAMADFIDRHDAHELESRERILQTITTALHNHKDALNFVKDFEEDIKNAKGKLDKKNVKEIYTELQTKYTKHLPKFEEYLKFIGQVLLPALSQLALSSRVVAWLDPDDTDSAAQLRRFILQNQAALLRPSQGTFRDLEEAYGRYLSQVIAQEQQAAQNAAHQNT